jgi:hypothetical protein
MVLTLKKHMTNSTTPPDKSPECCRRSFAASIKDTAKRLLEDPTIAPRAVAKERMTICEQCDRYREQSQTCEICLCFMPLKTASANMKCPIDKWMEWTRGD